MERDLFSVISDEHAQALVGGHGVETGVDFVDAAAGGWHHLGPNHVNPSPNGNDQIDAFGSDPTAQLHNFDATAGQSQQTPTE
ncbi:MAG: hypothetical protein VKK43_05290 [Synechococcaceae cyanobacterium]|nr:hypothetical protein [Synechococcaceae cyanobacterium]